MNKPTKSYKVKVGDPQPASKHPNVWTVTYPTNAEVAKKLAKKGVKLGSITVDMADPKVWPYKGPPKKGVFLVVEDLREKPDGWSAHKVRYFRPEDLDDPNIIQ
ncbi:MAG: hypothetical protein E4H40_04055 [Candidatus Brocadiia bacterium]|nr:MAG: hypothetical protein E4H40_04055 [Candidatus Brocadiia bacterium]